MKFDTVASAPEEQKKFNPPHNAKSHEIEFENIESFYRYDNISVLLMKKGTKGNFRFLSTIVNDGKYPCSWCVRVHYTKGHWTISVAPHDTINKEKFDANLLDSFEAYSKEIKAKYYGYKTYICFDDIKSKAVVEKIVSHVIEELRQLKLDIEHPILYLDYKKDESNQKDFHIKSDYFDDQDLVSEGVEEKYLKTIKLLIESATEEEQVKIEKIGRKLISEKILPEENKEFLDQLSEKYIPDQKRISISLSNLLNSDFDDE